MVLVGVELREVFVIGRVAVGFLCRVDALVVCERGRAREVFFVF